MNCVYAVGNGIKSACSLCPEHLDLIDALSAEQKVLQRKIKELEISKNKVVKELTALQKKERIQRVCLYFLRVEYV